MSKITLYVPCIVVLLGGICFSAERERDRSLVRDLAKMLDANGDRQISDKEAEQGVAGVARRAAVNDSTGLKLREAFDKNRDGRLDAREARAAVSAARENSGPGSDVDRTFRQFDRNNDGMLSGKEIGQLLDTVSKFNPMAAEKLDKLVQFIDRNRDGHVSKDEATEMVNFISEMKGEKRDGPAEVSPEEKILSHAQQTMQQLDKDKDGVLSRREAGKNRRLGKVFKKVDADGDMELTQDELFLYLKSLQPQKPAAKEPREK